MKIKRNFKDSVFTKLFGDPEILRELYCALGGVHFSSDIPVSINTLENVLYMDLYNDISFVIGGKLIVLIEHQSTINPNMALRMLLYISRVYEKIINRRTLYSEMKLTIPYPEFYVLYNGTELYPDECIIKLSDLFIKQNDYILPEKLFPLLELKVKVININEGKNKEIMKKCKKLKEYSEFISKTNTFLYESGDREEAVKKAIQYCEKHGILKEFLEIHGSEVLNMLLTEWNLEEAKQVWYEDGITIGEARGEAKGEARGRIEGRTEGYEEVLDLLSQGFSSDEIKRKLQFRIQDSDHNT